MCIVVLSASSACVCVQERYWWYDYYATPYFFTAETFTGKKELLPVLCMNEWVGKSYKKCETNFLRFMPEGTISSHIEHTILYIRAIGTLCTLILCWEIICMKKRKRFYLWEIPSTLAFPTEHHFPPFLNIPHGIGYPFMNNQVTAAL